MSSRDPVTIGGRVSRVQPQSRNAYYHVHMLGNGVSASEHDYFITLRCPLKCPSFSIGMSRRRSKIALMILIASCVHPLKLRRVPLFPQD